MPEAKVNGQSIFYQKEGKGKPLFLLHDLLEDHTHFEALTASLKDHFEVIRLDFRGAGQSKASKEAFSIEDLALDVLGLADHLKIEKFHVLGDSLGGAVAQVLAYKHPERLEKLILSNTFIKLSKASSWYLEMAADLFKQGMEYQEVYRLTMPWFYSSWFLEFEENIEHILKEVKGCKHPLKYKDYLKFLKAMESFDSSKGLQKISCPTLIIMAEEDLFVLFKESRALTTKIKDHQVELCPGGHKSKRECPSRYHEVVLKFLKAHEEEPGKKGASGK